MKAFHAAALLFAVSSMSSAQTPVTDDPYERLISSIASPEMTEKSNAAFLQAARGEFAADPDMAEIEAECSGTIDAAVGEIRAMMDETSDEDYLAYRAAMLALLRKELPADQAAEAATFYSSEFGQRVVQEIGGNLDYSETLRSAMDNEDGKFGREAMAADSDRTARSAARAFNSAEGFEIAMDLASREWPKTMVRIQPQLQQLKLDYMNTDLTPEENAMIEQRMERAILDHVEQCFGPLDLDEE